MLLNKRHFYEFGPFRLNPAERLLTRQDQPVALSPKSFDLLVFLVTNHGRLVAKEQIFESVWAGSFVEDSNLTVCISTLRRALGEKDQYIETVTKAGYRFTAPVREWDSTAEPAQAAFAGAAGEAHPSFRQVGQNGGAAAQTGVAAIPAQAQDEESLAPSAEDLALPAPASNATPAPVRQRRWTRSLGPLALVVTILLVALGYRLARRPPDSASSGRVQSLAVLPFQNLNHDPNSDFLGFSLADSVITKLGYVSALSVRPSSAVEKYRGQVIDIQKVGDELKVDTLLTGNLIREGDNLRITPQLVDVKSNRILWKGTIDLKYDKLLTVQDKVAHEIVKQLELNLTPSEAKRLSANAPSNALGYEYYLRGVDLYARRDFPMAIKMLEKSAEIDPDYAPTWAQIGTSHTAEASFRFGGREHYQQAQAAYEKALALDPAQLETHIYMANLLTDTGRVEQAVPLLRDAMKTNPNNAEVHWELGYAYRFGGMLKESVAECERARSLDPGVKLTTSASNGYLYLGQYDKFLASLPDDNNNGFLLFYRGFGQYLKKNHQQAAENFDRAFELDPSMLHTQVGKALSYGIQNQNAQGLEVLRAAEKKIEERGVAEPEAIYKVAEAYAVLGDKQSALRVLQRSIENGFFAYPYFERDPLLDNLRNEPEFARLMEVTRQRHQNFQHAFL